MTDVEYVARVVVERVERRIQPKGTMVTTRRTTTEDRVVRDKAEVMSFTVRAGGLLGIRTLVTGMMEAGMPDATIKGEPTVDDDEEDEEA